MGKVVEAWPGAFNLANHLRSHTGERPYRCSACPKGFRDSTGLLHHQVSPTPSGSPLPHQPLMRSRSKKIFGCSECEKLFRSPRDLERHVLVHTGEKPFPCLECGKFFRHECYLKRHRLLHGPERPFPCHVCGKGFITLSNLSRHLKLHRGMD
ncbi:Flt3-interacting zinc finger protein 1 [Fukomys damarensis]|uniref:Flt3-interacting zinc finger protein 1 n=1 Tax=Fukomys damarensis TaxID=885580 RepID=A0A091DZF9_FUKDA|nr:Flt3-interacting zinc finger protein 1 [Fukomys damarensis]